MRFLVYIFLIFNFLFASDNLFDKFNYTVNNYGHFVLSKDKKSFYSLDPFSLYQIKQIDINTTKVIAKYKRYKDIDLKSDDEKLVQKFLPKVYNDDDLIYCVDRKKSIIYYANKLNQIVAYNYKFKKKLWVTKTLIKISKYSKIKAIKLLKDSSKLLVALEDTLVIFDTKTKSIIEEFGVVNMSVNALAISPNFKYIAVSDINNTMKIYDYNTKQLKIVKVDSVGLKESFHASINTIKFLDDDKLLYASSLEGVQLLSIKSGKVIKSYIEHKLSPLVGIRDNTAYFITSQAKVYQYDLKKSKFIEVYSLPLKDVKRVVSNGKNMLISQKDGKFIWYDLKSNYFKDYHTFFREHFTASFDLHPSKLQFARVSSNHAMQVFDILSGKEVFRIKNKAFDIAEIFSFLDDDIIFYSSDYCGFDKKEPFVLIDTKRKRIRFLKSHLDTINSFQLSNDKKYLITASYDRTIKLWKIDLKNLRIKELNTLYTGNIPYSTTLSKDEKSIAISSENGDLYIYGVDFKKQKFTKLKIVLEGKKPFKTTPRKRTKNEQFNTGFYTLNTRYYNLQFYDNDTKLIVENYQRNFICYDLKTAKKLYKLLFFNQRDWVKLYCDGKYESSKNGYKYIDDKFYDIFKKDKIVLKDPYQHEQKLTNKEKKNIEEKNNHEKLPLWVGFIIFIIVMMIIPDSKRKNKL